MSSQAVFVEIVRGSSRVRRKTSSKVDYNQIDKAADASTSRSTKKRTKKVRKKCYLPFLPLELFLEIAQNLLPDDLLRLSRASRGMRSLALSRQSHRVWAACIKRSRLPPCPKDLSEPRYVAMVYENICDVCGDECKRDSIHYVIRVRLCNLCYHKNIKVAMKVAEDFDESLMYKSELYELIPRVSDEESSISYVSVFEVEVFAPHFLKVLKAYKSRIGQPDSLKSYVEKRKKRREAIIKHCSSLQHWIKRRDRLEKRQAKKLRDAFIDSILDNVRNDGYSEKHWGCLEDENQQKWDKIIDDTETGELKGQKLKRLVSRLITVLKADRKLKVEQARESHKQERLRKISAQYFHYVRKTFEGHFGEDATMPSISEFLRMERIVDILESARSKCEDNNESLSDTDSESDKGEKASLDLDSIFAWIFFEQEIKKLVKDYGKKLIENHSLAIEEWTPYNNPDAIDLQPVAITQLFLASSFFYNRDYDGPYYIPSGNPAILGVRNVPKWFDKINNMDDFNNSLVEEDTSFTNIKVHASAVEVANTLLRNLGLPLTAPMSEVLRQTRDRILCERCHEDMKTVTTWPLMIRHFVKETAWFKSAKSASWRNFNIKMIDDHSLKDSRPLIRVLEKQEMPRYAGLFDRHRLKGIHYSLIDYSGIKISDAEENSKTDQYRCNLCESVGLPFPLMAKERVEAHIQAKHGKAVVKASDLRSASSAPEDSESPK